MIHGGALAIAAKSLSGEKCCKVALLIENVIDSACYVFFFFFFNFILFQESNGPSDAYAAISNADRLQAEPESLRKWREEQRERLEVLGNVQHIQVLF